MSNSFSIDIPSVLQDVRRHWWNILLASAAALMLTMSYFIVSSEKSYTSTTVLAISSSNASVLTNVSRATTLASTMTNILNSDVLKRMVSSEMGPLSYRASASYISNTNLITLTVRSGSPKTAFQVLHSIMDHYMVLLEDLMSDVHLITLQQAAIPVKPDSSRSPYLYLAAAFIAGGGLYAAAVVLLSVMRDTIKSASDIRHKLDARFLGSIPYLVNKKHDDEMPLLNTVKNQYQFQESFQAVASRIMSHMQRHDHKVLMITSVLPSEGKTTCAVNLAMAMEQNHKKILLVDGDFRNPSVARVMEPGEKHAKALSDALKQGEYREDMLYQIPGTEIYCLTNAQSHMQSGISLSNGSFGQLIRQGRENFDLVIVDSGPIAFVSDAELMKHYCDAFVLIVAQDAAPARAINDAIEMLDEDGNLIGCIYKETRRKKKRRAVSVGYGMRENSNENHEMKEDR